MTLQPEIGELLSTCIYQFSVGWNIYIIEKWTHLKPPPNPEKPFLFCKQNTFVSKFS